MTLPTEKTPAKADFGSIITHVYGPPKVGKSTFCSKFDGAIFLATEQGLNHLECFQIPITSWPEFLAACGELATTEHNFRTVVIDTIDNLFGFATEFICQKNKIDAIADLQYGKGWALLNAEFRRAITKLSRIGMGLVFVSHTKEKKIDSATGGYVKSVPSLTTAASAIIIGMADMLLFFAQAESEDDDGNAIEKRIIHARPSKFFDAGSRIPDFPAEIPLSYEAYKSAWNEAQQKRGDN